MTDVWYFVRAATAVPVYAAAAATSAVVAQLAAADVAAVVGDDDGPWRPVVADGGAGWVDAAATHRLPQLMVDLYRGDDGGQPTWAPLLADRRYLGAILKVTEGVTYDTRWFSAQWPALRAAAGDRYGATFFRGAYHYLLFGDDGPRQAAFFLRTVEAAGGWGAGDLIPIVDVELGSDASPNHRATATQVVDVTSAYVAAIKQTTGQQVMIYGRGAMRDLGIDSRFGGDYLWNPGYVGTMPSAEHQGWPDDRIALWQYTDGTHNHTGWPTEAPGLGAIDASVYRGPDLRQLRSTLLRK